MGARKKVHVQCCHWLTTNATLTTGVAAWHPGTSKRWRAPMKAHNTQGGAQSKYSETERFGTEQISEVMQIRIRNNNAKTTDSIRDAFWQYFHCRRKSMTLLALLVLVPNQISYLWTHYFSERLLDIITAALSVTSRRQWKMNDGVITETITPLYLQKCVECPAHEWNDVLLKAKGMLRLQFRQAT